MKLSLIDKNNFSKFKMLYLEAQNIWEKDNIEELRPYLFSGPEDKCLNSVVLLKNLAIGSNKQKENVINANVVPRLLHLLIEEIENEELIYEIGALLCTLSKGTPTHLKYMIDFNAIQVLIKKITQPTTSRSVIEICLRTLRSLFNSSHAQINSIYETNYSGIPFIAYLLNMITKSKDVSNNKMNLHNYSNISIENWHIQECILNILASSCKSTKQQNILCQYSCTSTISDLLLYDSVRVSKAALNLLSELCHENSEVSKVALETRSKSSTDNYEIELIDSIYKLFEIKETQILAAKCLTNLFRSDVLLLSNKKHEKFVHKSLRILIQYCKKDNHPLDRIEAANILSYLIELDTELQKLASICDHLILTLSEYLTFNLDNYYDLSSNSNDTYLLKDFKKEKIESKMKEVAFKCFSSLGSNDEEIRKKIIESESVMLITVNCLSEENLEVKLAALHCLHSLSRSVRQLQTVFQDHLVWIPLKTVLLGTTDNNILSIVSSTLCNLLLEFSPTKPHFLDKGVVEILCSLTKKKEANLRLNGIWALMNMAFQAEQSLSMQILNCLGTDQIFNLLKDSELNIVLKTLGLLRNVLNISVQIDFIMKTHGNQIMEIIKMCLNDEITVESELNEVKEEALCILANVAHGDTSKEFIISNDDLLRRLLSFLSSDKPEYVKLQIATIICINNLVWNGKGCSERKNKLKQMNFPKVLKKLVSTSDNVLFDKVKSTLTIFTDKES